MERTVILLACGALFAPVIVSASTVEAPRTLYQVNMELRDGDRLVGSPRLKVAAGATSNVDIGDAAGNRYTLAFSVTPRSAQTALFKSTIDVVAKGNRQNKAPWLEVALGKPATIAFGEESATAKPFRVDLTISKAD